MKSTWLNKYIHVGMVDRNEQNILFVMLVTRASNSKHDEFFANSDQSVCLVFTQVPASPEIANFVQTTTDIQTDYFTPCACVQGKISLPTSSL